MANLTHGKRLFWWWFAAVFLSFVVMSLFFVIAPTELDYRYGIALAEISGIACLSRLPCTLKDRILCIVIYAIVAAIVLYYFSIFVALWWGDIKFGVDRIAPSKLSAANLGWRLDILLSGVAEPLLFVTCREA